MTNRHWFYLGVLIVIGSLLSVGTASANRLKHQQQAIEAATVAEINANLSRYLTKQTDPFKLVRLAKLMRTQDPTILQPIIERAYALAPKNRDITVLASQFHPELKAKILEIDPLYADEKLVK